MKLKAESPKDILIHIALILVVVGILLLGFFYIYLPAVTNHKETITVPNLEGMPYEKIEDFLVKRNLRYEVTSDSSFSGIHPPLAIIKQYPKPGAKVKVNRKIYISLNAKNPPMVKMPRLTDGSVKNAQLVLQSYGLVLGDIKYVPDLAPMAVLKQLYQGKEIEPGAYIPKGAKVDLIAGDGYGNQILTVPNVVGKDMEEADFLIKGSSLNIGVVIKEHSDHHGPGIIFRQKPEPGSNIRIGETIDIWISTNEDYEEDLSIFNHDSE